MYIYMYIYIRHVCMCVCIMYTGRHAEMKPSEKWEIWGLWPANMGIPGKKEKESNSGQADAGNKQRHGMGWSRATPILGPPQLQTLNHASSNSSSPRMVKIRHEIPMISPFKASIWKRELAKTWRSQPPSRTGLPEDHGRIHVFFNLSLPILMARHGGLTYNMV